MIKRIEKILKSKGVDKYKIREINEEKYEAYYSLQKLEATRNTESLTYEVTIYLPLGENQMLGSASFNLPYTMTVNQIAKKVDEAISSAQIAVSPYYELVEGVGRKTFKDSFVLEKPLEEIDKVANIFFKETSENKKFNSLEVFYKQATIRLVNSKGVDYKKISSVIEIEAIPSYDGVKKEDPSNQKVELYKYYKYPTFDKEKMQKDAKEALSDVEKRFNAKKIDFKGKKNVILRDGDLNELVGNLISLYSYQAVFSKATDKKIGDVIQDAKRGYDKLTVTLMPGSKADRFDGDGVLLEKTVVLDKGVLASYFGNNQYAQYLGLKPTGNMRFKKLEKGKKSSAELKREPHIEIISLSGIQVDPYADYIGGEVRLANYFDGEKSYPIFGFSFSGSLTESLKEISLSKETKKTTSYEMPSYALLKDLNIL